MFNFEFWNIPSLVEGFIAQVELAAGQIKN